MSVPRFDRILCRVAIVLGLLLTSSADAAQRPNIVLIMADDIGYENLACYGSEVYETPNLDRLAAEGIRFDHAHSQPVCTPSRVQIMTGLYNSRNYIRFGLLDPGAVTFANLLRGAGYRTMIAGKWQLQGGWDAPARFGFDEYCLWQLNRRPSRYPNPGLEIDGRQVDFKNGEFGPDVINDYVCDFIARQADSEKPFLAYYPMVLPHWPFVPTPDHPDWDPTRWRDETAEPPGMGEAKYWPEFVRYTDKLVGRVLETLERTGQRDNTLVIWTGDNGTSRKIVSPFRGRAYHGGKASPKDNGTHVGFIARWPGMIAPGRATDALVDFADVLPTLTEAAAVEAPDGLDGVSLLPVLADREEARTKDAIYCWYERNGVREKASQHARDQRYKLYASGAFYDTVNDPDEAIDLATGGVPAALRAEHAKLKTVLDRHATIAQSLDERQTAKRLATERKR